jgi:hypothetical protein
VAFLSTSLTSSGISATSDFDFYAGHPSAHERARLGKLLQPAARNRVSGYVEFEEREQTLLAIEP